MNDPGANPTLQFLPLLTHADHAVRQSASELLLGLHGQQALTFLRRLLDAADHQTRRQAAMALQLLELEGDIAVKRQPFRDIYIECLGSLRVYVGGRRLSESDWLTGVAGRSLWLSTLGVLAFLAHCGPRGATPAELSSAVWGGQLSSLTIGDAVHMLRHALAVAGGAELAERALQLGDGRYALDPASYTTDAQVFERTVELAETTVQSVGLAEALPIYEQAYRLYGGPYMGEAPRGAEWECDERARLSERYTAVAVTLAEHRFALGRYRECVAYCRQALQARPGDSAAMIWLLHAHERLGLRVELQEVYRVYLSRVPSPDAQVVDTYTRLKRVWSELALE